MRLGRGKHGRKKEEARLLPAAVIVRDSIHPEVENMTEKLDVKAWALAGGTLYGGYLGLATLLEAFGVQFLGFNSKAFEFIVQAIHPEIQPTAFGALLALPYGFVCGAISLGLLAWLHNAFACD